MAAKAVTIDLDEIDKILSAGSRGATGQATAPDREPASGGSVDVDLEQIDKMLSREDESLWDRAGRRGRAAIGTAVNGATAGLVMPGVAGLKSWMRGTDYNTELNNERRQMAEWRDEVGPIPEIAGALVGGGKLTALPKIAKWMGGKGVARGAGLAAAAGAEGAAYGATSAYSEGTDVGTGALIGGGLGVAGQTALSAGRKILSPNAAKIAADPERAAAAKYLEDRGIKLSAGQKVGSLPLQRVESEIGRSSIFKDQQGQLTNAASTIAGGKGTKSITPEWEALRADEFTQKYDQIRASKGVKIDTTLRDKINTVEIDFLRNRATGAPEKPIRDLAKKYRSMAGMSGEKYIAEVSKMRRDIKLSHNGGDPYLGTAKKEILEALEDAADRQLPAGMQDLKKETDRSYSAYLTIVDATHGKGSAASRADGTLSPASLSQVITSKTRGVGPMGYARGYGPLTKLSKSANKVMDYAPDTGSGARLDINQSVRTAGAVGMGLLSGQGDIYSMPAITGAAVGYLALKPALGKFIMSKAGQGLLSNQRYAGAGTEKSMRGLSMARGGATAYMNDRNSENGRDPNVQQMQHIEKMRGLLD